MKTYFIADTHKNGEHLNLDNSMINGHLIISKTNNKSISLENCNIKGHLIIAENKSGIELTGSTVDGSIIVYYVKDGQFLHFDKLNKVVLPNRNENKVELVEVSGKTLMQLIEKESIELGQMLVINDDQTITIKNQNTEVYAL